MCDYERAIDAIIEEQAREEIEELHKAKRGLRAKLNPIDETIVTKDTFHQNLDGWKHEFLDKSDRLSANEMALIYQYTEFIKNKC
jgi:hypothetical protein